MTPAAAARLASSGPQKASASTVTMTTLLPCRKASSACSTAAIGSPVDSTMISISGLVTKARQSSVRCVLPCLRASAKELAAVTSGFQPSRARFSLARVGERSAIPRRWMPGVVGIWLRYIEPNLPAPITPMRSGLASAARAMSMRWRLIVSSGNRLSFRRGFASRGARHAIVFPGVERREIAVCDMGRALEAADGVLHGIVGDVDDLAVPRRHVGWAAMDQRSMEENRRACRSLGRDDATLLHQLGDRVVVDHPQRIGRGGEVVLGLDRALLVALRNEPQRAVEFVHLVDEHREVHGPRLGHVIIGFPGAIVLMPLPDVAVERGLSVDLELMDVGLVLEELLGRLDEAGTVDQRLEHRMIGVHGEGGAHHVAGLLAHILFAALLEDAGDLRLQDRRFLGREVVREEEIAFLVEVLELLLCELHCFLLSCRSLLAFTPRARSRPSIVR